MGKFNFYLIFLCFNLNGFTQDTSKIVIWSNDSQLAWEDYKGVIDSSQITSIQRAFSCLRVKYYEVFEGDSLFFEVENVFVKDKSWSSDTLSIELLQHEQLHFDIDQLYVRKIRKRLFLLAQTSDVTSEKYKLEIRNLLNELNQRQNLYDQETAHGLINDVQKEWNIRIKNELKSLEKYYIPTSDE